MRLDRAALALSEALPIHLTILKHGNPDICPLYKFGATDCFNVMEM